MSQMRMQNQLSALRQEATYQMDTSVQQEVKQVLNIVRLCDPLFLPPANEVAGR